MSNEENFNALYDATFQTLEKTLADFNNLNDTILRYKIYNTNNFREWVRCKDDLYDEIMEVVADAIIQFPEIAEKTDFVDLVNMIKFIYNSVDKDGNTSLYNSKTQRIAKKIEYDFKENIITSLQNNNSKELSALKKRAEEFCNGHPVPMSNKEFAIYSKLANEIDEKTVKQLDYKNPIKMMFLQEKTENV